MYNPILMTNCGAFETCKLVRAFYASKEREIPFILARRLEMILEDDSELAAVRACILANGTKCYLSTRSEQGYDKNLEPKLKPLKP